MKTYRIGIVGAGFGATGHLPALANHPRFEVVAVASPSNAPRVAREWNVPEAFRSCAEMVASSNLDAVTVASPPFAHHHDVLTALAAGKHVIAEKPFALSIREASSMVDAAKTAGVATGVAHEFRFVPEVIALKELAVNGHLGDLRNIELTLLRHSLRRDVRRPHSWWFERERGGGLAGAIVSHLIDGANWLACRPPLRTLGFVRTANPHRHDGAAPFTSSVDDGAFALLDYGEGLVARLTADATTSIESYVCAMHGEKRTGVASGDTMTDLRLFAVDREQTDELACKPSAYARFASASPNVPPLMELYDEFAKQIEGMPNALPSFEDALRTQEALAAIGYEV
ncbi:MAG: Gfo/Idh/MocA family oxidoreductase [Candidatus Eremiobacteraeota bacterium]|nr:Gfo/Idh/MocA family oxidoreductase [Candidatus Eremiobacteraeota bacterium]